MNIPLEEYYDSGFDWAFVLVCLGTIVVLIALTAADSDPGLSWQEAIIGSGILLGIAIGAVVAFVATFWTVAVLCGYLKRDFADDVRGWADR